VILAALAFGAEVRLRDILDEGIRHIDAVDVAFARELANAW